MLRILVNIGIVLLLLFIFYLFRINWDELMINLFYKILDRLNKLIVVYRSVFVYLFIDVGLNLCDYFICLFNLVFYKF